MTASPLYLDSSQPIAARVDDLVARLTLEEKVSLMSYPAAGIPRLNIPAYNYWNEALHGVARNGQATVFPQAIGMAASWNPALVQQVASAISDEARAKYHETLRRKGFTDIYQGLTFWSPNVNIFRDPRWGRGQETWGEDPVLTGEMGTAFVRGLQGDHPRYMKAAACAKHYAVHSGPERDRHTFNAAVSKRDLYGTYLPAFKKLVMDAKVESVMGAYNRTLDEPCCASKLLLEDILRNEWHFDGHVVSDCGALTDIHAHHKVTNDAAESAALAVKLGCDLGCDHVYEEIPAAIDRGLMTEADLNLALSRTLTTRFRLGMFDPDDEVPYAATPMSVVACKKHVDLAYKMATETVVLLKNNNHILPIKPTDSLMLTGPTGTSMEALLGNYYGLNSRMVTLIEGMVGRIPEGVRVEYHPGCLLFHPNAIPESWAPGMSANKDVTVAFMGLAPFLEGEEGESLLTPNQGDRSEIGLPAAQIDYLKKLSAQGAKIVLVLTGGGPIALGEIEDIVQAILWVGYPGQEGGRAVADILYGDVIPSGKLPLTWPKSLEDLPPFEDYNMAGRTYRFATAEPLFPFGFGLSYTQFAYHGLKLSKKNLKAGESLGVSVTVTNVGAVKAAEVVQCYLSDLEASVPVPVSQLVGFERVTLKPGQQKRIRFTVTPEQMMLFDHDGKQVLEPGKFLVSVGGCSPSERGLALGAAQPVRAPFQVNA
ncbi:MAG: glycoside hydrolase family 3 N-terminal domain-containing protein [Chloroflexota bacterium]